MRQPQDDKERIKTFGERLEEARRDHGFTQTKLASVSGLKDSQVSDLKTGNEPTRETITPVMKCLKGLIKLHAIATQDEINDWLLSYFTDRGERYLAVEELGLQGRELLKVLEEVQAQIQADRERQARIEKPTYKTWQGIRVIGRKEDIRKILEKLKQGQLVSIVGPPGIGKTEVARQIEKEAKNHFPYVKFILLENVTNVDQAYGMVCAEVENNQTRILLILDNCEQLRGLTPLLLDLTDKNSQVYILTTSRLTTSFGDYKELKPLDYPIADPKYNDQFELTGYRYRNSTKSHLLRYASIQLVLAVVKRINVELENALRQSGDDVISIARICEYFEGLPLALILAGTLIAKHSLSYTKELIKTGEIEREFHPYPDTELTKHHNTLQEAIKWTYDLLDDEEKTLFCRLAVFKNHDFRERAAEYICDLGDLKKPVKELLQNLVLYQLITDQEGWYTFAHGTLYHFVYDLFQQTDNFEEFINRFCAYMLYLKVEIKELQEINWQKYGREYFRQLQQEESIWYIYFGHDYEKYYNPYKYPPPSFLLSYSKQKENWHIHVNNVNYF